MTKFLCTQSRITFLRVKCSWLKYIFTDLEYPGHCIPQTLVEHEAFKAEFKADITEAVKAAF